MFAAKHISYNNTGYYSSIVLDYLDHNKALQPFYTARPDASSVKKQLEAKSQQPIMRKQLVTVLQEQYAGVAATDRTKNNIEALLSDNCFTVTTAHQPNLFTGPLYFAFKILHAIRIADDLNAAHKDYRFVPVYYMGSEDADFAELNHTYVEGKKILWNREQKGAVGRMTVDDTLLQLIGELEGQIGMAPHGNEVIGLFRDAYTIGRSVQDATFELVNRLYGNYGLVVLIPDHPALKALMAPIIEEELFAEGSLGIVTKTSAALEAAGYQPQAHARPINLFYLKDDIRERIEKEGQRFQIVNTNIVFTEDEMRSELQQHPERFSPNVILRGLYQEILLPNLAFVGGGGELAYWLQLKDLFSHHGIVYPLLVLRNSFLLIEAKWQKLMDTLQLDLSDIFQSEAAIMKMIVQRRSGNKASLNGSLEKAAALFEQVSTQAGSVDPTLLKHVSSIRSKMFKNLEGLEKKMLRAEKRKYAAEQRQVEKLKAALFPNNSLQERVENFSAFYAKWGSGFIDGLYRHSASFNNQFTILTRQDEA